MITQESIEGFLDRLASADATPGGGSAAAIMGAMGASLVSMVCNLSIGKKGYESVQSDIQTMLVESQMLRRRLTALVADDVAAFDSLMAAYKRPKNSEVEKAERVAAIQAALRRATEVPLDCARVCAKVVGLARRASGIGYHGVISDGGVAALAANSAARGAALNVYINAPSLKDRTYAEEAVTEIEQVLFVCAEECEAACSVVRKRIDS